MQKRVIAALFAAAALAATPTLAAEPYEFWVPSGSNAPVAFGSEPTALKVCNGNSYLVKLVVDGTEVRPRANQCLVIVGKDIQAGRYAGTPPTTNEAAFTIKIEIIGVKGVHGD
ncbi:MAG: hypothetical protein ABL957_06125 [Parvularculaceae bacterium]